MTLAISCSSVATKIDIQNVSHGIAAVKVTSSRFIDHLQIGEVNGEWKIINALWVPNR